MNRPLPLITFVAFFAIAIAHAVNPVPFVSQPLVPASAAPASGGFTLTLNGTGFVSTSVVNWNGSPRSTVFVNATQLTATITSSDVASAGTGRITVTSPAPGGGVSNLALFPVAVPRTSLSFSTSSIAVGSGAGYIASADFNGDGHLDLAVTNIQSNTVSILLGNGDGTFQPHVDYAAEFEPTSVTTGDFNHDGHIDLAVSNDENILSIFLGNGDGTFQPRVNYPTTQEPSSILTADFNGDGNLDLAVAYFDYLSANNVGVLLGNGDGTFQAVHDYTSGVGQVFSMTVGDANRDGKLDLLVTNLDLNNVVVLAGNGDGTFQSAVGFSTGAFPEWVAAADVNGDGNLDLLVTDNDSTVSVLSGHGDGTFATHMDYPSGRFPSSVTAADLNGDGKLDLAIPNGGRSAFTLSTLLGNGDGSFQNPVTFAGGQVNGSVAVGDFNNDGMLDLAIPVSSSRTSVISVLLQDLGTVINLAPAKINFPVQTVGTVSVGVPITLTNNGSNPVAISSISPSSNFASTNNCGTSIAAGASCTITA